MWLGELTDRPDMTKAVDWNVKNQIKPKTQTTLTTKFINGQKEMFNSYQDATNPCELISLPVVDHHNMNSTGCLLEYCQVNRDTFYMSTI